MNKTPKTFSEIFNLKISDKVSINSIEIPIIQRDYAQGRESKEVERIRKQFLKVLHDALTEEISPVKLDFIYGNIADGKLIPLDGQQRLTTLFLLHWYIAKKEKIDKPEYQFLNNFAYRTRFSSDHFCKNLVDSSPDFKYQKLSEWITDQSWYMFSWDYDPTIKSMLVMLDEIHNMFNIEVELWPKITKTDNPLISFYFLALEDMGLTDSLYIKMNSRGKPLTMFEHFKAEFEVIIKNVSTNLYNEFVKKADNDWVDMFWKYRGDDNAIDDEFMRYFRFVTETICYSQEINIVEDDFDLAWKVYGKQNLKAEDNLRFLFKAFDCWKDMENIDAFFKSNFSTRNYIPGKVTLYSDETNLFLECCNKYGKMVNRRRAFPLSNALLLYATLVYLINDKLINEDEFKERIRIIRNLIQNSPDEIRADRMQALLNDTKEIILSRNISTKSSGYNENQKEQEQAKINWRQDHNELINELNRLEDHTLLQGSIAIIGLTEPEKLKSRIDNFYTLFSSEIDYLKISNALLSINDYSQLASWRFLFGNKDASSWRELFVQSKRRQFYERTKEALLQLLDAINGDFNEYLDKKINDYINSKNTPKSWRYYFLKYPTMRKGKSGVFCWRRDQSRIKENQYEIFMMNTPLSLVGRHWDPFLYTVYSDKDLNQKLSLGEYGSALIVNSQNVIFKCFNKYWEVCDREDKFIERIEISQEEGIDVVDRIEILKKYIISILN
jgi:hypothetical protein